MFFSVIIPVYNRPEEISELLQTLGSQSDRNFEVIVVEDGSTNPCKKIVEQYMAMLQVSYFYKPNSGPGLSRNFGADHAKGDFYIFLDSDCLLPSNYIQVLNQALSNGDVTCFGGPDKAHPSFTPIQKAISYSMTSFFTTGGIRGGKERVTTFHPRSFNMGFKKEVYLSTGGFAGMRFGEDIDLSLRMEKAGFQCLLLQEAYVFHKRRTDFTKFFKQIYNSGIARINLFKRHPTSLKLTHFFPAAFLLAFAASILFLFFGVAIPMVLVTIYLLVILLDATVQYKNLTIGCLAVAATLTQMLGYGSGFLNALWQRVILNKKEFKAFEKNFYQ